MLPFWVRAAAEGGLALILLPAFSSGIEATQGLALANRVSTILDVLANTTGGYVGLLVAMTLRAMIHARDRMIERELWERRLATAEAVEEKQAGSAVLLPRSAPWVTRRFSESDASDALYLKEVQCSDDNGGMIEWTSRSSSISAQSTTAGISSRVRKIDRSVQMCAPPVSN